MTGYGAAAGQAGVVGLSVEVRSVNQRHREIKINAPREYYPWEAELKRQVAAAVGRGRVEVTIARAPGARGKRIVVRHEVVEGYLKAFRRLKREYGIQGEIELGLFQGRNEIFQQGNGDVDAEREMAAVRRLLARALRDHGKERTREGAHIHKDLSRRLEAMKRLLGRLRTATAGSAERRGRRLRERIRELADGSPLDEVRLAQEIALMADRADVTEELVRLESHLGGLRKALRAREPVGKRFEFLLQEVGRELNTIASKSTEVSVTGLVVDGKTELEKLREQIQNVE